MKRFCWEWILVALQLFMFYVFPFFVGPTDVMGMVLLIILATFVLAVLLGVRSKQKWKYSWPVCTAICFVPSIFLHYNATAWIHAVWYLVVSATGLLAGSVLRRLLMKS